MPTWKKYQRAQVVLERKLRQRMSALGGENMKARPAAEPTKEMRQRLLERRKEKPENRRKRIMETCAVCRYRTYGPISELLTKGACNYLGITGEKRPCSALHCREAGVFVKGNPEKTPFNPLLFFDGE